jgi:hypothetical protein
MRKTSAAMTAAITAALTLPAGAQAATVTITGDAGAPVTLNAAAPTGIRNMHPDLNVALGGTERAFDMTVAGPVSAAAAPRTCSSSTVPWGVDYQGNGTYTVTISTYTNATCTAGKRPWRTRSRSPPASRSARLPGRCSRASRTRSSRTRSRSRSR